MAQPVPPPSGVEPLGSEVLASVWDQVPEVMPGPQDEEGLLALHVVEDLADLAAELLDQVGARADRLRRCFSAVEAIAGGGADGGELVAFGFLDALAPEILEAAVAWLGPRTLQLLDGQVLSPAGEPRGPTPPPRCSPGGPWPPPRP